MNLFVGRDIDNRKRMPRRLRCSIIRGNGELAIGARDDFMRIGTGGRAADDGLRFRIDNRDVALFVQDEQRLSARNASDRNQEQHGGGQFHNCLGISHVHHVDIGAETNVVGEVPAVMIGIFVNHDLIAVPKPVAAIAEIGVGDAEIKSAEPEATWIATGQAPNVAPAETTRKASVFPGMIDVESIVISAGVVAHPLVIGVDVRSFGMIAFIGEGVRLRRSRCRFGMLGGRRPVRRDVTAADIVRLRSLLLLVLFAAALAECIKARHQEGE